jgi:hypothetical protein
MKEPIFVIIAEKLAGLKLPQPLTNALYHALRWYYNRLCQKNMKRFAKQCVVDGKGKLYYYDEHGTIHKAVKDGKKCL